MPTIPRINGMYAKMTGKMRMRAAVAVAACVPRVAASVVYPALMSPSTVVTSRSTL